MFAEVFGIFSSTLQAESAINLIKGAGISASEILVVPVEPEVDLALSHKRGILWGSLLGALMGVAFILYSDSPMLKSLGAYLSFPLVGAFGWGLYGFILGGTGLLAGAKKTTKPETVLSFHVPVPGELARVESVLKEAGASGVRTLDPLAA